MNLTNINTLPAITWRHLKINDTTVENLPEKISSANLYLPAFPEGISQTDSNLIFDSIKTGMSENAEDYTNKNAQQRLNLSVDAKVEQPIIFSYRLSEDLPFAVQSNQITAQENSNSTFVFDYISCENDFAALHAGTTKIYAKKDSFIKLIYVQTINSNSISLDNLGILIEENAKVEVVQILLGGKRALSGVKARLLGDQSKFKLNCVYFGTNSQNIDLNFVSEHVGCDTITNITAEGALANNSVKTLRSTISFETGAKRSVGHETEDVLLFSPTARNRTVPLILCGEEDVEGQHAATVGKIDKDKLFYLQSRGLSEIDAKKLLLDAKFSAATSQIPSECIQKRVRSYLERSTEKNAESI